jgi:uncharacterized protein DUF3617
MKLLAALLILASSLLWAADKLQPLDVKLGLWETTSASNMSGAPPIPEEALAKMTPEQRAKFEAMIKARTGAPTTRTHKNCLTKEKLEKDLSFGEDRGECTHNILSSSSRGAEVKFHCTSENMTSEGIAKFEAVNSENVKGTVHMNMTGSGKTMTMDTSLTSHYVTSSCGDIK